MNVTPTLPLLFCLCALLILPSTLTAQTPVNFSGSWETPDGNVIQVTQTGLQVRGVYAEVKPAWKSEFGFSEGSLAFTGTVEGRNLRGERQIRFAKSKTPRACQTPPIATGKFEGRLVVEGQCAGFAGTAQSKRLADDCSVRDGQELDPLNLIFLRGGLNTKGCPRFLLKVMAADLAKVQTACPLPQAVPATLHGAFDPFNPGAAPKDSDDRRLEDFFRHSPHFQGIAPPSGAYIGDSCFRPLLTDPDFADTKVGFPVCSSRTYLPSVVAEFYWSAKRLADGISASLESLAAIDKLLSANCGAPTQTLAFGHSNNSNLLNGILCSDIPNTANLRQTCTRLQNSCRQDVDFSNLVDDLQAIRAQHYALGAVLYNYPNSPGTRPDDTPDGEQDRLREHIRRRYQLEAIHRTLGHSSPWFSSEFRTTSAQAQKACEDSVPAASRDSCKLLEPRFSCEGVKARARATRDLIIQRLQQYSQAMRCLTEDNANCDEKTFRDAIQNAPPIVDITVGARRDAAGAVDPDVSFASTHLALVDCRKGLGVAMDQEAAAKNMLISAAVLALMPVGVTWVAGRLGTVLATAGVEATNALIVAALSITLDASLAAATLKEDLAECSNIFYQIGSINAPASAVPQCPAGIDDPGASVNHEYLSCALGSFAKASVQLVPSTLTVAAYKRATDSLREISALNALRAERQSMIGMGRRLPLIQTNFCFLAGTPVLSSSGLRPIESVNVGDLVLTRNDETGESKLSRVTATTRALAPEVLALTLSNSATASLETLTVTPDHPLYTASGSILRADQFPVGARLFTSSESEAVVHTVTRLTRPEGFQVFNLEVEFGHSYFAGSTGIWVHNGRCTDVELYALSRILNRLPLRLQRLFEHARISRVDLAALIDDFDAALYAWARRGAHSAPAALQQRLNQRLKALPKEVAEEVEMQMRIRRQNNQTFLGEDLNSLGRELDFPQTSQALRDAAAAKPYRDPFSNNPTSPFPPGPVEADHIWPVGKIRKMPGFDSLTREQQLQVIYNQQNIQPLPKGLNNSKGELLAAEWQAQRIRAGDQALSADYVAWLAREQERCRAVIDAQIRQLLSRPRPR